MTDNPPNGFDKIGMFRLIADKIERNPALLQIALDNIARWIASGADQQHRLRQWEGMIRQAQASKSGMEVLLAALREDSERAAHLREFAPFAGILSHNEILEILRPCAFAH
jgi:hypothetical protein